MVPCLPSGSWSTAMTSELVRMLSVVADALRMSLPISNGAAMIAHMLKWVRYSVALIPPLPTSSMSGSFQWPGPAALAWVSLAWIRPTIRDQLSLMSPEVRQRLPTEGPQFHGWFLPHSQMLYTIGRPVFFSASRILVYRVTASTPWLLQLSYLR